VLVPTAYEAWLTVAQVASQSAEIALTYEILCAKKELAVNLESSADQTFCCQDFSLKYPLKINIFQSLSPMFLFHQ
jgi:hypothetical protein